MTLIQKSIGMYLISWVALVVLLLGSSSYVAAEILYTPEGVIITHYPEHFDLTGNIDGIDENGVVVHDRYFAFAPHVRFMTPQSSYAFLRVFEVGQEVSLVLNENRQVSIMCATYQN